MVDTQRFNIGAAAVQAVSRVAHEVARRNGRAAVLQVVPYVPLDVDCVARILESLDDLPTTTSIQGDDGIKYYKFSDAMPELRIESAEHLTETTSFGRNVKSLCEDMQWSRRARAQHTLLALVAGSSRSKFTSDFLASRTKLPMSKIQSALNDFVAQNYVHMEAGDADEPMYVFPQIEYPTTLLESNLAALAPPEESGSGRKIWWLLAAAATVVLIFVVMEWM